MNEMQIKPVFNVAQSVSSHTSVLQACLRVYFSVMCESTHKRQSLSHTQGIKSLLTESMSVPGFTASCSRL